MALIRSNKAGGASVTPLTDCTFTGANANPTWTYSSGVTGKSNVAATKIKAVLVTQAAGTPVASPIQLSIDPSTGVVSAASTDTSNVFTSSYACQMDLVIW